MSDIGPTGKQVMRIAVLLLAALISLSACSSPREDKAPHVTASLAKESPTGNRSEPVPVELRQAEWTVQVGRAGDRGKLSKKVRKRVTAQRPRLARVIRSLYDSLFLGMTPARKEIAARFSQPARSAFKRASFGTPERAHRIKTLRRFARVAIQVGSTRRASAAVTIKARGLRGSDVFRVQHHARLWLERAGGAWRVVAFDARQQPLKKRGKR